MPRQSLEELSARKPTLVYIAGNTTDAEKVERVLAKEGVDYALSMDAYVTPTLLGGQYPGLFFYVPLVDYSSCRRVLEAQGLIDTVELEHSEFQ